MSDFSNGLSPAEIERLAKLSEECGEVVKAVGKILLYGYLAKDGAGNIYDNRKDLEGELGDVGAITDLMVKEGDVSLSSILKAKEKKAKVLPWRLMHQKRPEA